MTLRERKGRELAARGSLVWTGTHWNVPSQSGTNVYIVRIDGVDSPTCTCADFEVNGQRCKHIYAVETHLRQLVLLEAHRLAESSEPAKEAIVARPTQEQEANAPRYRQDWPAYNAAQVNEKALFQSLLHDLCAGITEPSYVFGRPRLPLRDMLFSATFKVYSTVSTRRFMCDLADAQAKGYLSRTPHYNSIFNYFETPDLTPLLRALIEESTLPLRAIETRFAVDSTGFSTCRYARWYDAKYGEERERREWIKAHVMCGVITNIVTSVEITEHTVHDSLPFKPLVAATARNFEIEEVTAEKAYSSRKNLEQVDRLGGVAYIPFKSNSTGTARGSGLWNRLYHYYHLHHETFLEHYHRRSLVESTFSMIQAKFGASLRSKSDTAQVNELLCKVLCHNICVLIQSMYELGIEADFSQTA